MDKDPSNGGECILRSLHDLFFLRAIVQFQIFNLGGRGLAAPPSNNLSTTWDLFVLHFFLFQFLAFFVRMTVERFHLVII